MFWSRRRLLDYAVAHRAAARRRFIRTAVIGLGFLSGLWVYLGFNPKTWVGAKLEAILLSFQPEHEIFIKAAFHFAPTIILVLLILLVYRRAGLFGFVAVGLGYAAGLMFGLISIPLLALASLIAIFSVKR